MNKPPRLFHGWLIVAACFVVLFVISGAGRLPMSLFYGLIMEDLGWTRSDVTSAVGFSVIPIMFAIFLVGWLVDTIGSKKTMLAGCLVCSASLIVLGAATRVWHFSTLFVLVHLGVSAATFIPVFVVLANWFRRRRGLALGIAFAGLQCADMIGTTASDALSNSIGWRPALVTTGLATLAMTIPLVVFCIQNRPSDMGLSADGESDREGISEWSGHSFGEATRSRRFWFIFGGMLLASAAQQHFQAGFSFILFDFGQSKPTVAVASQIATAFAIVGTIAFGFLADRFGPRRTFMIGAFATAVSIALLILSSTQWIMWLWVVVSGLTVASMLFIAPMIIADCHGLSRFGIIYATLFFLGGLGSVFAFGLSFLRVYMVDNGWGETLSTQVVLAPLIVIALASGYVMNKARPPEQQESPPGMSA